MALWECSSTPTKSNLANELSAGLKAAQVIAVVGGKKPCLPLTVLTGSFSPKAPSRSKDPTPHEHVRSSSWKTETLKGQNGLVGCTGITGSIRDMADLLEEPCVLCDHLGPWCSSDWVSDQTRMPLVTVESSPPFSTPALQSDTRLSL